MRHKKHIIPPIPSSFFIPLKKCIVGQHSVNYSNKTVTVAIIGQASLFSIKLFSNVHSNFQTLDPPLRFILCSFVSVSHLLLHILLIIGIDYKMLRFKAPYSMYSFLLSTNYLNTPNLCMFVLDKVVGPGIL